VDVQGSPDDAARLRVSAAHMRAGRRRRAALIAIAGIAVAALAVYAAHWWTVGRFFETTDDAYVGGNVTVIAAHVSGYVERILVQDNQYVRAGQPLMRLHAQDYRAVLAAAQAAAAEREARLRGLTAQAALERALIREADAKLDAKRADAEFAALEAHRFRDLARTHAGSTQDAERSQAALKAARAAVAGAAAGARAARQRLLVVDTETGAAEAALAETEAIRQTAALNLGYTVLRAPIDGYVGDRSAHVGSYVTAGTELLSIVPARGLWVDANFKEDQIRDLHPGDAAVVVADVRPSQVFHGHVASLSPATGAVFSVIPPQNATGNFTKIVQRVAVRIALDRGGAVLGALRPGLSTSVSVDTRLRRRDRSAM